MHWFRTLASVAPWPRPAELPPPPPSQTVLCRVEVTFGHQRADGLPVAVEHLAAAETYLKALLATCCGGGRVSADPGFYRYDDGTISDEPATSIWCYGFAEQLSEAVLLHAASVVCRYLHQRSVLVSVQRLPGFLTFVGPEDADDADLAQLSSSAAITSLATAAM